MTTTTTATATTTAAATAADTVAYHRDRSWQCWEMVDDAMARGELEEASSNVWYAAAHAIKAAAADRGWPYDSNDLVEAAVVRLTREEGAPLSIWWQYMMATEFHRRFFGGHPSADGIRYGKDIIAEFIIALENTPWKT